MDEAEKYQQRLQAIAEKRRLQDEQERVKREMEDERIRLQQLKRKSLRDQWLLEGPPMSPDSTTPRSPLWGQQAHEIEQKIDSLQAKTDQLTEEVAKLTEEDGSVNDGQTHVNNKGIHILDERKDHSATKGPVLQNGQGNGTTEVGAAEDVKRTLVTPVMTEVKGPNGEVATDMPAALQAETGRRPSTEEQGHIQGDVEEGVAMATSVALSQTAAEETEAAQSGSVSNGPASKPVDGNGAVTLTFLGFSDPEKVAGDDVGVGVGVCVDDDGGAIMRAERVIVMDEEEEEEEDVEEEPKSQSESRVAPQTSNAATHESQEPEEAMEAAAEAQPSTQAHAEAETDRQTRLTEAAEQENKGEDGEAASQSLVPEEVEATVPAALAGDHAAQPSKDEEVPVPAPPVQTAPTPTAASVDVRPQSETSELKIKKRGVEPPEPDLEPVEDAAIVPVTSHPCQFEDVPLNEAAEAAAKAQSSGQQPEHEPLLVSRTAPLTGASAPPRAEGADIPKRKTCQCCSVM